MPIQKNILRCKYECTQCGKKVFYFNLNINKRIGKKMHKEHLCWDCAFWNDIVESHKKNIEIIGDDCYEILPFRAKKSLRAGQFIGGGKTKYILKKNGQCYRSNDYWYIGRVPVSFRLKLPPTAWWTNKHTYDSLTRYNGKCVVKNCMDRFHCYRYDFKVEYEEPGLFVPKEWQVGTEYCPAYIPTKDIKDFDQYVSPSDL